MLALVTLLLASPFESAGFEQIATDGGVRAFEHPDSDTIRLAAEGRFDAPPQAVREVLLDYRGQIGKVGVMAEAEILDRGSEWVLVYQRLDLPVISDRDYNLYVRWSERDGQITIAYQALDGVGRDVQPGNVRVIHNVGTWTLSPVDGGAGTLARFDLDIDFAGWVPRSLARYEAARGLPRMFHEVAGMLSELPATARRDGASAR